MSKIDLKKELKNYYSGVSAKEFSIVDVPPLNFLMIDGQGYPGTSQEYQDAMMTLYPLSYTLKFMMKKKGKDYVVMPLEGLWWAKDMMVFTEAFMERKDEWLWTSMIMQPEFITQEMVDKAIEEVKKKKDPAALSKVRFEVYNEGLSVQILYFGSYADEGPTIERLHTFIHDQGYELRGKHHEIYLSDPRRTKPEKLKTIIRQPVKKH
ncbi:MAG: GyrI-like domain-containing protein [Candidatus Heimdallarchaeota archaeon]|nr:MAG: GyrI-like domain-containing protein [Candidatus Heimdallarchaeota archaeon]